MAKSADRLRGNASERDDSYSINLAEFRKRLKAFYSHWKRHKKDLWGSSNVLVVATPDSFQYVKSSALQLWLFGVAFSSTILVFMEKQIHCLCGQNSATMLECVKKSTKETINAEIVIHVKTKEEEEEEEEEEEDVTTILMDDILNSIKAQSSGKRSPTVGYIMNETAEGKLLEKWTDKLQSSGLQLTDITNGFTDMFAVKDAIELKKVKEAASWTSTVMKTFVLPKLKKIIIGNEKVSHSSLMEDKKKEILKRARNKQGCVEICYPPIFQSGGVFDLSVRASSNDENLYFDWTSVIICAIGSSYTNYCSNVARTFLFDANEVQRKAYQVLLKAQEAAIGELKSGNKVSAAYLAALSVVGRYAPEFSQHLTQSAGNGIGLEFCESGLILDATDMRILKAGMVFNVSLGFQDLKAHTNHPKTENFSLLLADTVVINKIPEVMTISCSKAFGEVAYRSEEDDKENEKKPIKLVELGVSGQKMNVSLEAHKNRFTYSTSVSKTTNTNMRVDIMYGNIKHAFFQAAVQEKITLLHFHLHNPIIVGTKKTKDVQFYSTVIETERGERSANAPGEIEERQHQCAKRHKLNKYFRTFVDKVNDLWKLSRWATLDLRFQLPMRYYGFQVASGFIAPTSRCLVNLIGKPFLVLTLSEIKSVNLEHVGLKEMSFDMRIVFKDSNGDEHQSNYCIASFFLERVQNWLQATDLEYTEDGGQKCTPYHR